jgi:hypothetical protein
MNESSSFISDLEMLSSILIRCFVIGVLFITFWFIFFLLGGDTGYMIHSKLFQISRHEYELLNHCGLCKGLQFSFFPLPLYCDQDGVEAKEGITVKADSRSAVSAAAACDHRAAGGADLGV